MTIYTRRDILKTALALSACAALPRIAFAALPDSHRTLQFYNTHTGESLKATYWENGEYVPDALQSINHVLRDHRTNKVAEMDPHLLDILANLHATLDSRKPFEVISGYRAPESNAMLHQRSSGVASHSMHMFGKAIDIRLTDRSLSSVHNAALAMRQGGVGYYPSSDFVHVDTGRIRSW